MFLHVSFLFPVDKIKAVKDVWLVRDEFLGKIFNQLQTMKSEVHSNNSLMPYLYDQYNVHQWYKSPLETPSNRTVHLFNALIEGFNEEPKIPKYILMIPDVDIIIGTQHFELGVFHLLEEQLQWLFTQVQKSITRRREDILSKRAGAVSSSFEPRVIWVSMIK